MTQLVRHQRIEDLAAASIDWDLSKAESGELEAHLAGCPACRATLAAYQAQSGLLRDLASADAPAQVRRVVLSAAAGRDRRPATWRLLVAAILALLVVAGSIVVGSFLSRRTPVEPNLSGPRVWSSTSIAGTVREATSINSLTRAGSGWIAGGLDPGSAVIWQSSDGRSWRVVEDPSLEFAQIFSVTSDGASAVAVGRVGGSRAAAWTTNDGIVWQRAPESAELAGAGMQGVAPIAGEGFVAAGVTNDGANGVVWRSADGRSWTRQQPIELARAALSGVSASNGTMLAWGELAGKDRPELAVWMFDGVWARMAGGLVGSEVMTVLPVAWGPIALVNSHDSTALWELADSGVWQPMPAPTSGQILQAFAHGETVALVVHEKYGGVSIVRSSDGNAWTTEATPLGPADVYVEAVAGDGEEIILIVAGDGARRIWRGTVTP